LAAAKKRQLFDSGTIASVESFLRNPEGWAA
jgi:hypothetical protein